MTDAARPPDGGRGGRRLGVRACFDGTRLVEGDVVLDGARVAEMGARPAVGDLLAAPGYVDLQVNGFAGVDLLTASVDDFHRVGAALAATGVTAFQPTFVSAPCEVTLAALRTAAAAAAAAAGGGGGALILPAHLEGPFLSPRWPGAHVARHLRAPDTDLLERLLAGGPVGEVTLAPELAGGLQLVDLLVERGVTVAVGHSDATADQAHSAFARGASVVTHAFNAHRRLTGRDPGPAGAALSRDDVWVHLIADGVHVAPEILALVDRAAGGRLVVATDAMTAAGLGDGDYAFGGQRVHVAAGRATLEDGRLAGSVATLDGCVRQLVRSGVPLTSALSAATSRPGRVIGRPGLGRLREGGRADLVVLDPGLHPVRTYVAGRCVDGGGPEDPAGRAPSRATGGRQGYG